MNKTFFIPNPDFLFGIIDTNGLGRDEVHEIGKVTFDDGTIMYLLLYGQGDCVDFQGSITGLGVDAHPDIPEVIEIEGYSVALV